ncbi:MULTISPECIES: hypothetical protein [Gammaproteobacteria]|uniref:hypothetical protein n=1 Tax=Gammaproteobacteria TaxID=1236 RepID=UPI000DCF782D|nr:MULTISPECIES: hypothetical protein [Gammaproteobacteria]RTE87067.1 hypothetical protein DQX04_01365 [Aliidiomarina sp. B3213]TCZ93143.1 hypothetical protein EYQ95_03935 [Lysobacter sp. N42]
MKVIYFALIMAFPCVAIANTADELENVVNSNIRSSQAEDVEGALGHVHTQSPNYLSTREILNNIFATFDLQYDLIDFVFVAEEAEYSYARVTYRVQKISGPAFQDNEYSSLWVFKKEKGIWKIWSEAPLSAVYL